MLLNSVAVVNTLTRVPTRAAQLWFRTESHYFPAASSQNAENDINRFSSLYYVIEAESMAQIF